MNYLLQNWLHILLKYLMINLLKGILRDLFRNMMNDVFLQFAYDRMAVLIGLQASNH